MSLLRGRVIIEEIAEEHNRSVSRVYALTHARGFPKPVEVFARRRIWNRKAVNAWFKKRIDRRTREGRRRRRR